MDRKFLLEWLSKEDFSRYGECKCRLLDELVDDGLVQVGNPPPGRDRDYAPVSLTDAGVEQLAKLRANAEAAR